MPLETWRFVTNDDVKSMYFENQQLRADLKRFAQGRRRALLSLAVAAVMLVLNVAALVAQIVLVIR